MNLFQFVFLLFISWSLYKVIIKIRIGQLSIRESLFWISAWVFGGIVISYPGISVKISDLFGISRGVDLVIYSSIIFLYYISYKIYLKIDSLQRKIKELSTKIAIKEKD